MVGKNVKKNGMGKEGSIYEAGKVKFREERIYLQTSRKITAIYKNGELGGQEMPEDANPGLGVATNENYLYFTLPMALNYQRDSYKLWEAAKEAYSDPQTRDIFTPACVTKMHMDELRIKLLKYKVALQPNKHTEIWYKLCHTFMDKFNGDVRKIFKDNDNSVKRIKDYILANKKCFPYLSGTKILNYWLYVISQYTDVQFSDRQYITVAPDTHVIQASERLGLISQEDMMKTNIRDIVSLIWEDLLDGTGKCPIDVHTPLWLWSRSGFEIKVFEEDT